MAEQEYLLHEPGGKDGKTRVLKSPPPPRKDIGLLPCALSLRGFVNEASTMYVFRRYIHIKTIAEVKLGFFYKKGLIRSM